MSEPLQRFRVLKPWFHPRYNQVGECVGSSGSPSVYYLVLRFDDGEERNFDREDLERVVEEAEEGDKE